MTPAMRARVRSLATVVLLGFLLLAAGCGSGSGGSSSSGTAASNSTAGNSVAATTANVVPITVNSGPNYFHATVTICQAGTSNCVDVPNVLVDTGSYGLRVLASALSGLSLPQSSVGGAPLSECVQFLDNSLVWGPVRTADVKMGGEVASGIPIHVIGDPSSAQIPGDCGQAANAHASAVSLGGNGILGIGVFVHDCGQICAGSAVVGQYYGCPEAGCSPVAVPLASQVQNPVARFAAPDNNGTIIELPPVGSSGQSSVTGSLVFGIGTQSNNGLGSASVLRTDSRGNFTTVYNGQSYAGSFIDSGSNAVYFLSSSSAGISTCSNQSRFGSAVVKFYCPSSIQALPVAHVGSDGGRISFNFSLANAESEFNTGNYAFSNIGGPFPGGFDWGAPFFFGRNIFTAIEGAQTPAGAGPYVAY